MKRRRQIIIFIVLLVAIGIIGYAIFTSRLLIAGPSIEVTSPENGMAFDNPFIELRGVAKNTSFITLDGKQIFIDEKNVFSEKLLLPPGTSIMKLNATDRFERETELTLWYTYTGTTSVPESFTATVPTTSTSSLETESVDATSTATTTIE